MSYEQGLKSIFQAVVLRAIKDFYNPKYRNDVIDWVVDMEETFPICAESIGLEATNLREIMVDKMIQIDTFGTVSLYLSGTESRMRK